MTFFVIAAMVPSTLVMLAINAGLLLFAWSNGVWFGGAVTLCYLAFLGFVAWQITKGLRRGQAPT